MTTKEKIDISDKIIQKVFKYEETEFYRIRKDTDYDFIIDYRFKESKNIYSIYIDCMNKLFAIYDNSDQLILTSSLNEFTGHI